MSAGSAGWDVPINSTIRSRTAPKFASLFGGGGSGYWNGWAGGTWLPTQRVTGPMSRVTILYHTCAKALSKSAWSCAHASTSFLYSGSAVKETSLVSIPSLALSPDAPLIRHCQWPPGPWNFSHSFSTKALKYSLSHLVGSAVHWSSKPLVKASLPLPVPHMPGHGLSGSSFGAGPGPSGQAPWALPKAWPPPMSATVSLAFIAMRPKASRMSFAESSGIGCPMGPSGFK
mmetsp:Transcript_50355/g.99470  ORF Transcript_50355/g.99470 Transcript_50355/m.99470 type:complete len:230 (-) Transcript_50355:38-727(-)